MPAHSTKSNLATLTLAAIGVVYGDIGTSPLYTVKEVFSKEHGLALNQANLLGIVSLIVWGLTLIVTLKYVTLVLRANNRGEGGIMALTALAMSSVKQNSRWHYPVMLLGLAGASLFFGDGVITPAISVLSAIEGLEVAAPALHRYILPLTVAVLVALYLLQRHGTAGIGKWFGPIMFAWFATLAAMGVANIVRNPAILAALNPLHALRFLTHGGWLAFVALGAVVLALTGSEALYADMGHFGKRSIRSAWFFIVFPALSLNYLGQGALLLSNPAAVSNPFFQQLGPWSVFPLVVLSTMATVIASQATISGAFSVTHQAISLGFLPRMEVVYTSEHEKGQIYIPAVNWLQFTAVILAVVGFGSSSNLASAYGVAATSTMLITTILTFFVIRYKWRYPLWLCFTATGFFLIIDIALFSSTTLKIPSGGWFPLVLGTAMVTVMLTWKTGRGLMHENLKRHATPLSDFFQALVINPPPRVPGTAVFFRAEGDGVPQAMVRNLRHNKVLHERTIFLTVYDADIPTIPAAHRIKVRALGQQCYQVNVYYGFKDERDIPIALKMCKEAGLELDPLKTSFFIGRQNVIPMVGSGMAIWRETLFATMSRIARDAADYLRVPADQVIELGAQVEI